MNVKLPNGLQNLPKYFQNFAKSPPPKKNAQYFKDFAKVTKFRQIWSHCGGDAKKDFQK